MKALNITDIVTLLKCHGLFITIIIYLDVSICFAHSPFNLCYFSADTVWVPTRVCGLQEWSFKKIFKHFWLHWLFVAACSLSLVVAGGTCSLAAVHRLLISVASLDADHGLHSMQASVVEACGLSFPVAYVESSPGQQGVKLCPLHRQAHSTIGPAGISRNVPVKTEHL